jgi:hypothetical protein
MVPMWPRIKWQRRLSLSTKENEYLKMFLLKNSINMSQARFLERSDNLPAG